MYARLYLEDHLSTHPRHITKTYIKKLQSFPAHKAKGLTGNNARECGFFDWKMHFRTFIFHGAHLEYKRKKRKKKSKYISRTSRRKWGGGVTSLRLTLQVLSEYANFICNDTVPPVSIPEPHLCSPEDRLSVLHWCSRCIHTQFVKFCMNKVYTNATSQYERLNHIFLANYIMTQTALWKPLRVQTWLFDTKRIKAVWNLTAEITVASG